MNKKMIIILVAVFVPLLVLLLAIILLTGRVEMNPEGTVGNSAGNINNAGLFCEKDGIVYFSNASDGGSLYSMTVDEQNVKKLNDLHARNILVGGKYIYFFQLGDPADSGFGSIVATKSFDRCNLDGGKITTLNRDVIIKAQLVDNYLYAMSSRRGTLDFYKLKIDKSKSASLADYEINPACVSNGNIYYNGTVADHGLYMLDTKTDESRMILAADLWNPVINGDYLYYMDVKHNYRICRYNFSSGQVEVLTEDRVDCFNVGYGYIYYQKVDSKTPQLICMRIDGSEKHAIMNKNCTNINMTSQFVYFQEYGIDNICYHSRLGSEDASVFSVY